MFFKSIKYVYKFLFSGRERESEYVWGLKLLYIGLWNVIKLKKKMLKDFYLKFKWEIIKWMWF